MIFNNRKYKKYSDEQLVQEIKVHNESYCLGVLYERYGHLVFGLCLKHLKNTDDAQDMTSMIFEQLPQKIQRHDITYFKSWLYTLSRNECLMLLRKKQHSKSIDYDSLQDHMEEIEYEEKEVKLSILEEVLQFLKEPQKTCIRLFYLEERSYQQVSDIMKIPLSTVKSAIQNGKRNLKNLLEQHHEFK